MGTATMRLGIFGGSFNPIHYGHLLMAEMCREQRELDQVWFVPAAAPPHKHENRLAAAQHRVEMLRLAVAGNSHFLVSQIELERGGISYTVDTLADVAGLHPQATLFFLMGADSLGDLPTWREPARICELAVPLVFRRGGESQPNLAALTPLIDKHRLAEIENHVVETPLVGLSSTEIRHRVASNRSIRFQTPRSVEQYILANQVYS